MGRREACGLRAVNGGTARLPIRPSAPNGAINA